MKSFTGMFLGTAAACLAVVTLGEHLSPAAPAGYDRLRVEHRELQAEADVLRRRLVTLETVVLMDIRRRAEMAAPAPHPLPGDPAPAERIPPQTLPTTPKE